MARTDHPSVTEQTSDILGLTIGVATNVNGEGVVCGLDLF